MWVMYEFHAKYIFLGISHLQKYLLYIVFCFVILFRNGVNFLFQIPTPAANFLFDISSEIYI